MLLLLTAALASPLFVQPEPDGFRIVDHQRKNIRAWQFAALTRDRELKRKLRWRIYGERFVAIGSASAGGLATLVGLVGLQVHQPLRRPELDPTATVLGITATAGLFLLTVPIQINKNRPRWKRVDTYYSQDEAAARIRSRQAVLIVR